VRPVRAAVAVGLVVTAWTSLGAGARATYGARTTADEPQYLLTAISLAEDRDLDIADELAAERYRAFHEADLPPQTKVLGDGRQVSPHDPLLPVLLAVPVALGGWLGAKLFLAGLAGVLAGLLTWTAHRRFAVPLGVAATVALSFSLGPPLSMYATQVYPELPAALATTAALAALTGPLGRGGLVAVALAVVALPWLGVKYVLVAAALAAVALARLLRAGRLRDAGLLVAALAGAGLAYVVAHRLLYGGWTPYATGDHFVTGEASVVGTDPDYAGRSRRLVGLLVDRHFGLVPWHPGWLLAVPAVAALARRRPAGAAALAAPLAAGWLTAAFVALTMHGWWWPGRQLVVVLPALVLAVAWWASGRRAALVAAAGAAGALAFAFLAVEASTDRLTWVVDFARTANPLVRAARSVLPDYARVSSATWALHAAWLAVLAGLAVLGRRPDPVPPRPGARLVTTGGTR
jgi:hypothetical protein